MHLGLQPRLVALDLHTGGPNGGPAEITRALVEDESGIDGQGLVVVVGMGGGYLRQGYPVVSTQLTTHTPPIDTYSSPLYPPTTHGTYAPGTHRAIIMPGWCCYAWRHASNSAALRIGVRITHAQHAWTWCAR